jgi:hypothetical protein
VPLSHLAREVQWRETQVPVSRQAATKFNDLRDELVIAKIHCRKQWRPTIYRRTDVGGKTKSC